MSGPTGNAFETRTRGPVRLMVMTERLKEFPAILELLTEGHAMPDVLIAELAYAMPFEIVGRDGGRFECKCSDERLLASLASLPEGHCIRGTWRYLVSISRLALNK